MQEAYVKLTTPIDFEILSAMNDGKRHTAPELSESLEWKSNYIGNELRKLEGDGLVERVKTSSMYTLSDTGRRALRFREDYKHQKANRWGMLVRGELSVDDMEAETLLSDDATFEDSRTEDTEFS